MKHLLVLVLSALTASVVLHSLTQQTAILLGRFPVRLAT